MLIRNQNQYCTLNRINNTPKSNNYKTYIPIPQDRLSFTGIIIKRINSKDEIKKILDLFYDSLVYNLEPNKTKSKFLRKIDRFISMLPFSISSKQPNSITEVIEKENKLIGGYSMSINPLKSSAHLGFITLAPEYIRTKAGIEALKKLGTRIYENANANNVKELTWTTNSKNKNINNLLKRLGAEKVKEIALGEAEYKISINDLGKKLYNLA